jgi:hypothetical protein
MKKATLNGRLYMVSNGKFFLVRRIAESVEEANTFCEKHKDVGVIYVNNDYGLIYIAENNPTDPSKIRRK